MQSLPELTCDAFNQNINHHIKTAAPLVVRGLVNHWPAVVQAKTSQKGYADLIARQATSKPLTAFSISAEHEGRIFYNDRFDGFNFSRVQLTLQAALVQFDALAQQPRPDTLYIGSTNVDHWLPEFGKANVLNIDLPNPTVSLWMSNHSVVAPHFDFPSNLACVISGTRQFTLFPPDQLSNLYVGPLDLTPAGQPISLVNLSRPDLKRFPRFEIAEAHGFTARLGPGDAILIPSMWWHQVEAIGDLNTLINYWFRDPAGAEHHGPPLAALQHAMLA
ncbi:cupin-like domain-containing protein, partial [Pseudomonadales bacterium]|nr:cupin-like domain-containing protein [Pseudomonadales bacterium]